jgi:hypothetical protein
MDRAPRTLATTTAEEKTRLKAKRILNDRTLHIHAGAAHLQIVSDATYRAKRWM